MLIQYICIQNKIIRYIYMHSTKSSVRVHLDIDDDDVDNHVDQDDDYQKHNLLNFIS